MGNTVILVGRLGQDPELRYTTTQKAVCNMRVATNEKWTDKATGEKKERTEWHTIVVWNRLAEVCAEFLYKGALVEIRGKLRYREFDGQAKYAANNQPVVDANGQAILVKRYTAEVVADDVDFLSPKKQNAPVANGQTTVAAGAPVAAAPGPQTVVNAAHNPAVTGATFVQGQEGVIPEMDVPGV